MLWTKNVAAVFSGLFLLGCDPLTETQEEWIGDVEVTPIASKADSLAFSIEVVSDTEAQPKCGDLAKCVSYETMNPLTNGSLTADMDMVVDGKTMTAGADLAQSGIFMDDGNADTGYVGPYAAFPVKLYAMDYYELAFDASKVTLPDGVMLSFSWEDGQGEQYSDSLTVVKQVLGATK